MNRRSADSIVFFDSQNVNPVFFKIAISLFALIALSDWWTFHEMRKKRINFFGYVLIFLPSLVCALHLILLLCGERSMYSFRIVSGTILLFTVPKLVFTIISAGGNRLGRLFHRDWKHIQGVAFFFACIVAVVQFYCVTVGINRLDVNRVTLASPLLPKSFDGYRVVQISDLHLGSYFSDDSFVRTVVDSVNSLHPDLIVFTGDLVNESPDEVLPEFVKALSCMHAPDGVYSVLGNHDFCVYKGFPSEQEVRRATDKVVRLEQSMGWEVLRDEHRLLVRDGDTLVLAGTDNVAKPRPRREGEYVPPAGSLKKALRGVPESHHVLLLTHDPWHWRREVTSDPRVLFTLAGHTHALHVRIGNFSPATWIMPEWGGKYVSRNGMLYVSTGVGGSVKYRLGAWPAIELITLRRGHAVE